MDKRIQKALENHSHRYNCCQAVACAFCDEAGIDEETVFRAGEGFGLGMGGMNCTCGAVSGAVMIAGLKNSCGDLDNPTTKADTYRLAKEIVSRFQEKNGSTVCRELKGSGSGQALRSCGGCIEDAAAILAEVLGLNGSEEETQALRD